MEESTEEPTNDSPTITDFADASSSAYNLNTTPRDYSRVSELSSKDISTFRHNEKPHYIIAHRGTSLQDTSTLKKDIRADLNIALGNRKGDSLHRSRTKRTEKIINIIKKKDPEHDVFLTGHSLGASTSAHAMATSKIVRDNVKQHDTFGAGSSFLQKPPKLTDEVRKEIENKTTHHVVKGDDISSHVSTSLIGKKKVYANTRKPTIAQNILSVATPLLRRTLAGKFITYGAKRALDTLQAHSLSNFTSKKYNN